MNDSGNPPPAPRVGRAIAKKQKRDQQIRRFVSRLRMIAPHVDRPEFAAVLRGFAMITLTLERSYAALRDKDVISSETNELRSSIDVIGRLVGQQSKLAAALGLTPTVLGKLRQPKRIDLAGAIAEAEVIEDA
jgi:hypothetical protein